MGGIKVYVKGFLGGSGVSLYGYVVVSIIKWKSPMHGKFLLFFGVNKITKRVIQFLFYHCYVFYI